MRDGNQASFTVGGASITHGGDGESAVYLQIECKIFVSSPAAISQMSKLCVTRETYTNIVLIIWPKGF